MDRQFIACLDKQTPVEFNIVEMDRQAIKRNGQPTSSCFDLSCLEKNGPSIFCQFLTNKHRPAIY